MLTTDFCNALNKTGNILEKRREKEDTKSKILYVRVIKRSNKGSSYIIQPMTKSLTKEEATHEVYRIIFTVILFLF